MESRHPIPTLIASSTISSSSSTGLESRYNQPRGGELDIAKKCPLVSQLTPKLDCLNEKILNLHTPVEFLFQKEDARIREEFKSAEEYWPLERKLCSALMNKEEISIEDVMRAIHLKSSDYRILNLLLYQLRGEKDDVLKNSFNVLRMFVKIYGASRAPAMLVKYITEGEQRYDSLLKTLDPQLALNYQKRRDEVIEEGGVLIEDEELTGASKEAGGGDGGEFITAEDEAGTGVFLIVGDDAEALGAGVCVGDFDRV
ncbi:hypothetical protein SO802_025265 [Lithocarpus litseifolius]|uniref:Uncharacterized protein n=1 Tax=Lithocarpus litseifolius TaxID=425828 RepID=A0AAW2BZJ5_9ROSI